MQLAHRPERRRLDSAADCSSQAGNFPEVTISRALIKIWLRSHIDSTCLRGTRKRMILSCLEYISTQYKGVALHQAGETLL